MKNIFILILSLIYICSYGQDISEKIKVNQVGYLTNGPKIAYVSKDTPLNLSSWEIKSSVDDKQVYSSVVFGAGINDAASNEYVYKLDFSDFEDAGNYYIEIPGIGRSFEFSVSDSVYNNVFKTVMKGFYYQRSGVDLSETYAGKWARPAEYSNDAYVYEGFNGTTVLYGDHVNTSGGWRDAGDPNKKVVPACIAVHQLLTLYEYFPGKFNGFENNIPPDHDFQDMNDYLSEIKVETDWLLTMQRSNGAVWHSVAQKDFFLTGMGSLDPNPRYLMPVSTTATADFAAALATAYRAFLNINPEYAHTCLVAAEKAWDALHNPAIWNEPDIRGPNGTLQYPEPHGYSNDPPGINNTGAYTDTHDSDEVYWAAGELYISTGKKEYLDYFRSNLVKGMWYGAGWNSVANLANFSFCLAFKDSVNPTVNTLKTSVLEFVNLFESKMHTTGFGTCLSPGDYYWGSNDLTGQYAYSFLMAYEIFGTIKYKKAALSLLNYLLGANSLNQTFISGAGKKPVKNIFHLPSKWDGISEVVPGLIPGGPNQYPAVGDADHANLIQTTSPPPAKCYIDSENSFACNEPTIYAGAVWAYVIGYFYYPVEHTSGISNNYRAKNPEKIMIFPNPCSRVLSVAGYNKTAYQVLSLKGEIVLSGVINNSTINVERLKCGEYFLIIEKNNGILSGKIIKI